MNLAFNIIQIQDIFKWHHLITRSAVILTESEKNLRNFHNMSMGIKVEEQPLSKLVNVIPQKLKFTIYTEKVNTFARLSGIISKFQSHIFLMAPDVRFFEFFIVDDKDFVNLAANVIYSEQKCGVFQPKLLNSFKKSSQKWGKKLENFEQFSNFHGCMITVCAVNSYLYYTDYSTGQLLDKKDGSILVDTSTIVLNKGKKYYGLTAELIQLMAKRRNFTIHYTIIPYPQFFSTTNNFIPKLDSLVIIGYDFYESQDEIKHFTVPFGEATYYYLITPNDLYSNYEKLIFAFDTPTWFLLFVSYGFIFGIISIIDMRAPSLRAIFFDRRTINPTFYALGIFFGIAQLRLPRRTLNRFILILYIWFCLIIRTCYQSMMFEFMTSDMRKPLPESIEDLYEMNYTIVYLFSPYNHSARINDKIIDGRKKPNEIFPEFIEFKNLYEAALKEQTKTKYAFLFSDRFHAQFNSTFKTSLTTMKNEKYLLMLQLSIGANSMLFEELNNCLKILLTSGISNQINDYGKWHKNKPIDVDIEDKRRVLTLEMLEYGFVLWLGACVVSFSAFLCELFVKYLRILTAGVRDNVIAIAAVAHALRAMLVRYHERL